MEAYKAVMFSCSYFTSIDYLLVHMWIEAILQHSTNIVLAWSNVYHVFKFFPGVVNYFHSGKNIIPHHPIAEIWDVPALLILVFTSHILQSLSPSCKSLLHIYFVGLATVCIMTMVCGCAMCPGPMVFSLDSYCRSCRYKCILFDSIIVLS